MPAESSSIPRLQEFKYRVEFNGLPYFLVQEFDSGERNIGVTKHAGGGQNYASKEAGFMEYHPAILKMIVPISGDGKLFWEKWMNDIQDPKTGNGKPASQYRRNFSLYELGNDGNAVKVWEFYRAWPSAYRPGNRHSMQKDKDLIIEIHVEYEYREERELEAA